MRLIACALFATLHLTAAPAGAADPSPYAGQQGRAIAGLSEADRDDLRAGRGWGLAKPAELNGWPGPVHVLELADALDLTEAQRGEVTAIFDRMQETARRLGADYIAAEAALDAAFAGGEVSPDRLADLTGEAGRVRNELRAVHLAAHLETRPVLSQHQIMIYNRLRGYGETAPGSHDGHGAH